MQVRSFYRFTPLSDLSERRQRLTAWCQERNLLGTVLLAEEGINGSLSGTADALDCFFDQAAKDTGIGQLSYRTSCARADQPPFSKLKVRIRRQLVSFPHKADETPAYVDPEAWNALISQSDVRLVDVRNRYETAIGAFNGAEKPPVDGFSALPDYIQSCAGLSVDTPLALYCTGGIRCEKAAGWLRRQGFRRLYQLTGGILNYLEKIPESESQWQGDCFVFDKRIAVDASLQATDYALCAHCQQPVQKHLDHQCG